MLFLVRHGRTAINVGNKLQGRIDHPLDEVGRQQAIEIASVLKNIDRVISSPLIRAKQLLVLLVCQLKSIHDLLNSIMVILTGCYKKKFQRRLGANGGAIIIFDPQTVRLLLNWIYEYGKHLVN